MSFYPKNAPVPAELKTADFVLRPLTTVHVELDHAALMDSKEMLRRWSNSDWPTDDFTVGDNRQDLAWHQQEHEAGIAFTYTILDPGESECLGCLYIKENNVPELTGGNHEAIVRFWVRQSHLTGGLDRRLLAVLISWFRQAWSFTRVHFHTNEQDHHQVQLLNASPLPYRITATIPNRPGLYRFYSCSSRFTLYEENIMTHPISRYLNVRQSYYPSFSADGRHLAFLSDITGLAQVWQVDLMDTGETVPWPDQLTFATDRVLSVYYSPAAGDNCLLYSHDVGGNEKAQLFLLDVRTGEEIYLSEGHEDAMHLPGEWSPDGRFFLFAANRRQPALFDLYLQPAVGDQAKLVWQNEEPGYLANPSFSPDGRRAAISRIASSYRHGLFEVNLETGNVRQLSPPDQEARYTAAGYSRDGRSLYVTTDLNSDFLHVAQLDLATLTWETLLTPNGDIDLMALSPNGRYLATVANKAGRGELELIDLSMSLARTVPMAGDVPGIVSWTDGRLVFSADSNRLAFSYTSAVRTSDVYVWNLDLNQDDVRAVTRSSHGGIPVDRFAAPELVHYPTFDGRDIPAWFFQPEGAHRDAPLPVVVIVHGGPESQFRPNFNFLAQYLVRHGYAVFAPNVRGSTGYGKSYSHLDDVQNRMDSVADLAYAAGWLKARPEIDGDHIIVYGGSYGGFMVLAALTHYPDLWAAGVDIVGISNLATFLENTSDYRRAHREAEYGRLDHERDFLESIAPMNHVDKIKVPLMVIHGANDPRVPLSEAEQLVAALHRRNVPVEFLVFDDEGHGIAKLKNKRVAYPAVVDFLDRVVAGEQ